LAVNAALAAAFNWFTVSRSVFGTNTCVENSSLPFISFLRAVNAEKYEKRTLPVTTLVMVFPFKGLHVLTIKSFSAIAEIAL
jgi:hypothetical protein